MPARLPAQRCIRAETFAGAPNYGIEGAESSRTAQLLEQRFAGHGAEQDVLVFYPPTLRASEPAYRLIVASALKTAGVVEQAGPGHRERGVLGTRVTEDAASAPLNDAQPDSNGSRACSLTSVSASSACGFELRTIPLPA